MWSSRGPVGCGDRAVCAETIDKPNLVPPEHRRPTFRMRCGRNSDGTEAASISVRCAQAGRQLHPAVRCHSSSPVSAFGYKRALLYVGSYGDTTLACSRMVSTTLERSA